MTISLSNHVLVRRSLGVLLASVLVVGALAAVSLRADRAHAGAFETFGVTVAGGNGSGVGADQLSYPYGVATGLNGKLYVADTFHSRIQECLPDSTACTTVAGQGGQGSEANQLNEPYGLAVGSNGDLYIADTRNNRVQKCALDIGSCTTVAGGNGVGAASDQLDGPFGVAVDSQGAVYISDAYNERVQKCVPGSLNCTTVAGGNGEGSNANQLNYPLGLAIDSDGNLYVGEHDGNRVQKCVPGSLECATFVGGVTGGLASYQLGSTGGVAIDSFGNLFVSDQGSNSVQRCALVSAECGTVAGGNGQGAGPTQFSYPGGIAFDANGNMFVADVGNDRVQKWARNGAQTISFSPLQNKFEGAPSFELAASATSGLPVEFSSTTSNICTVAGTTVTLAGGVGICTIVASQPGDQSFLVAPTVSRSFQVERKAIVVRVADSGASEGSGPAGTTISTVFGADRPSSAPLCVWYSTVGVTATGADQINAWDGTQDFTRLGVSTPKYVILGTNRTSGKISTKINYDTTIEDDEYFNVVVSKVTLRSGGKCQSSAVADSRVVLARDTGRVTIFDDDTPLPEN